MLLLPLARHKHMKSTNMRERLTQDIKRRFAEFRPG